MKSKRWLFSAGLLSLLLLLAACGEDAEPATDAGAAMQGADETSNQATVQDDTQDDTEDDGHGEGIEIPDGMAVPTISLIAEPDNTSGHNLFVEIGDFSIAPERASTEPVDGEGHLHLYIDGERTLRFYNQALYLDGLEPGRHEIMVEVTANNHSPYLNQGKPITAMTTITVPEPATDAGHDTDGHDGDLFESANPPTLEVTVTKDPKSGWNLFADVSELRIDAAAAGSDPVDGDGHLHLYIDGEKITRLYGPWWHLDGLDAGSHEIMIEATANHHSPYGSDGEPVRAMTVVDVGEDEAMAAGGHDQDSDHDADGHSDGHSDDDAMEDGMDDDSEGHGHSGSGQTLDIAAADADVVITATLANGELEIDDRRFAVPTGSTVGIVLRSDQAEEIHVHGYDLLAPVGPDKPIDLAFLADSPGTFEVELEQSGRFLFEIQVN